MSNLRFARQRWMPPAELGFNEVTVSGTNTGTTFDATGANKMTLFVFFTRVYGTGNLDLTVEAYAPSVGDWVVLNTAAVSAGVETMTDGTIRKATASTSQKYEVRLTDLFFSKMRIKSAAVTSASTDTLSIEALIGYGS